MGGFGVESGDEMLAKVCRRALGALGSAALTLGLVVSLAGTAGASPSCGLENDGEQNNFGTGNTYECIGRLGTWKLVS